MEVFMLTDTDWYKSFGSGFSLVFSQARKDQLFVCLYPPASQALNKPQASKRLNLLAQRPANLYSP
ncbi:hypothetical protein KFK09_014683 [Dendrobium nobile]|uniref:Uncharacterized protein n=1 Tax=Dendrobium nobile TaxID=94219 RepID=A0A8T3B3T1_DENNO|nr:hypothetical protein KFK09_014683 [Dendrobium nobile]